LLTALQNPATPTNAVTSSTLHSGPFQGQRTITNGNLRARASRIGKLSWRGKRRRENRSSLSTDHKTRRKRGSQHASQYKPHTTDRQNSRHYLIPNPQQRQFVERPRSDGRRTSIGDLKVLGGRLPSPNTEHAVSRKAAS
jgi:hypothetical protein